MLIAETSRLMLRQFYFEDVEAMNAVFGDAEVMRYGEGVQSPQWVRSWISSWINEYYPRQGFGFWAVVIKETSNVIGYCGLSRFPGRCAADEAEIGFRLARSYWGRGIATEAAAAVRDHGFGSLHLPKIVAIIDPANVASIRVAQKLGLGYERDVMFDGYDHPDHVYSQANLGDG